MKVLVPIKRVVDYNVKIRVKSDGSGVETQNVKMSANPFDENAIEEAVRLKDQGIADEIVVISIGNTTAQETLRTALAMGADRAVLIETDQSLEPLSVAKLLAAHIKEQPYDLVILGKQAIDDDCNQTGQMLASLLDWPQATFAYKLTIADGTATVVREIDSGLETLAVQLPAVITTDLRINEPRFPTMPGIMKAKQKPLTVQSAQTFNIDLNPRLTVVKTEPPPVRSGGVMVSDIKELVGKLHEESKVI